ncbi:hypothetical protein SD457_26835 [Coprobacillaceae bacterium CR2/5/TPMF4]|nr:hypothetical protein SD457_26835 [Coprobacillaceae bacterium CR2/5/TPMF4]
MVKNDTTTDPGVTPSDPNSGSNSSTAVKQVMMQRLVQHYLY